MNAKQCGLKPKYFFLPYYSIRSKCLVTTFNSRLPLDISSNVTEKVNVSEVTATSS